jgi:RNase H-like domain found in reverse transcriptase
MTTAHPDPKQRVCVFTDASDAFYSGMITQVPENHLDLPVYDQQHQTLAFTSGRFRGSQERWTIPEKEAFVVIETVNKHTATSHSLLNSFPSYLTISPSSACMLLSLWILLLLGTLSARSRGGN